MEAIIILFGITGGIALAVGWWVWLDAQEYLCAGAGELVREGVTDEWRVYCQDCVGQSWYSFMKFLFKTFSSLYSISFLL